MAHPLFAGGNAPTGEWAEFTADGFAAPVTGVVYRGGTLHPGMPLGGIGTGFVCLGTDGTLDYMSTIFNDFLGRRKGARARRAWGGSLEHEDGCGQFMKREEIPRHCLPFLGLSVGGKATVLTLQNVPGAETAEEIRYWGHYPVADLEYDVAAPVSVGLRAWTPFLPGDAGTSNTPGAVFEVRLRNCGEAERSGTVAFSFHGPRDEETHGPADYERRWIDARQTGVHVRTEKEGREYAYALTAAGADDVRAGGALGRDGTAWGDIERTLPAPEARTGGAALAADFRLAPGEERVIRFFLAWYAPRWQGELDPDRCSRLSVPQVSKKMDWAAFPGNRFIHMYADRFASAEDVVDFLERGHEALLSRILAWQQIIYCETRLPGWLRDALVNNLHVLTQVCFWDRSADPEHWCEEGIFSSNETLLSCPQQTCLSCDLFGEWPVDLFFSALNLSKLRVLRHYQKDHGQVPSAFGPGSELDMRWYDQQTPYDNQVYIQLVHANWCTTADDAVIAEFYESIRKCMKFLMSTDHDDDCLVDLFELDSLNYPEAKSQYHDGWKMAGATTHVAGIWLAVLEMVERMAEQAGDNAFAAECRRWCETGRDSLENSLWNEATGSYYLFNDARGGNRSDTILADQMIGECLAFLHGMPSVFPENRQQTVLETLQRLNVATTPIGIRVAVRPEAVTDEESGYTGIGVIPAYSTLVPAVNMALNGNAERGLGIVERVWRRMTRDLNMTWNMPGGLTPEGEFLWGHEYWQNTMLWILPLAVLAEDLATTTAPGGFAERIMAAARMDER